MIARIKGIPTHHQREYLRAENNAYKLLVERGFLPQGLDYKMRKIVVIQKKNPNDRNEHGKIYYFENWQEAAEALCGA